MEIENGNRAAIEGLVNIKKKRENEHEILDEMTKEDKKSSFEGENLIIKGKPGFLIKELQSEESSKEEDQEIAPFLRPNEITKEIRKMRNTRERGVCNEESELQIEELEGIGGALILIFRIICDIIGSIFGYGVLSPVYYNYF